MRGGGLVSPLPRCDGLGSHPGECHGCWCQTKVLDFLSRKSLEFTPNGVSGSSVGGKCVVDE